jgi:hypothetical protein
VAVLVLGMETKIKAGGQLDCTRNLHVPMSHRRKSSLIRFSFMRMVDERREQEEREKMEFVESERFK